LIKFPQKKVLQTVEEDIVLMPTQYLRFFNDSELVFNHVIGVNARFHAKHNVKNQNLLLNVDNETLEILTCYHHVGNVDRTGQSLQKM
jgi:hypothetical protein